MKTSEACFKAAEIMSERGHAKYALEDEEGKVCFSGAIFAATYGSPTGWEIGAFDENWQIFEAAVSAARDIIMARDDTGCDHHPVTCECWPVPFNNRPETSGEDVILLLKETGATLAEAGS